MRTRRRLNRTTQRRRILNPAKRKAVQSKLLEPKPIETILKIQTVTDKLTKGKIFDIKTLKQITKTVTNTNLIRRHRRVRRVIQTGTRKELSGPEHINQTGKSLYTGPRLLEWPEEMENIFVISMRPHRWRGLQARMGHWASKMTMFNATNGHQLSKQNWINRGIVKVGSNLSRGQIGCHDSHVRIWKHMIKNDIKISLILEDDANIRYTESTEKRLKEFFKKVKENNINYEMIFIGRGNHNKFKTITPGISRPKTCQGLFAYILTLSGAKKLLERSHPYRLPVDVLAERLCDNGTITAIAMDPRLCHVVPVVSDTAGII